MLHKFVDNEIDKNVHRQKCAYARPPWVGKLYKVEWWHFFVDFKIAQFCRSDEKPKKTNIKCLCPLIIVVTSQKRVPYIGKCEHTEYSGLYSRGLRTDISSSNVL